MNPLLLHRLDPNPVVGINMSSVSLLRLDQTGGLAPGNKSYKLKENFEEARRRGIRRLVSFGGIWSNHLHALAAMGREQGFETIGVVRGERAAGAESAMLQDARAWGMGVHYVSRSEYRRRNDGDYLAEMSARFAPCLVIPEGGANAAGTRGCLAIAELIRDLAPAVRRVVVPVGTGTTLAGIVAGLDDEYEVTGVSALKGASDLQGRVEQALDASAFSAMARWCILHDFHCGGFARSNAQLREFMRAFEEGQGIPLEPVYTGKTLLAVHHLLQTPLWDSATPVLVVHTGGLQGRRGYSWLCPE